MNENIDLTKILKDCPKGTKFYSAVHGDIEFISLLDLNKILFAYKDGRHYYDLVIRSDGKLFYNGECIIFPSKEQRDWSKFTAPWYKKEESVKPKFKVGDWITIDKPCQIINIHDNGNYIVQYCDDEKAHELSKNFCESYFHFWTIKDAKDGDVLVHSSFMFDNFIFIYNNTSILQAYCYYSNERNKFIIEDRGHHCPWNMQEVTPATKEQRDALMKAMNDAEYKWDAEKKELKKNVRVQ